MNKVKVLIEGYAKKLPGEIFDAVSSTTLIDTGELKIIVDPGCNKELLLNVLNKEGLKASDIDIVYITHYHLDHCLLMGLFENAKVFDEFQWEKGSLSGGNNGSIPGTDIKIISTPGHALEQSSLLVETKNGKILIGSDLFWWTADEEQKVDVNKFDEFAVDLTKLKENREMALKVADFIIPGHGKMFKVNK